MKRSLIIAMAMILVATQLSMPGAMIGESRPAVTGGTIECDTTLQMIPMTHTVGGGTIHWHITGENARALRQLILDRLDNVSIPYDRNPQRRQGWIDEAEMWAYVAASDRSFLESYLQGLPKRYIDYSETGDDGNVTPVIKEVANGETYDKIIFQGVEVTRSSLSSNSIYADTSGLVGQTADSNADIDIYMTISMAQTVSVEEIDLSDPRILTAPFECLTLFDENGTVVDEVDYRGNAVMRHWTVNIGFDSFYNPSVHKGTLYIIRTPAGDVYRYVNELQDGSTTQETMMHSEFNAVENPQILFIAMIFMAYLTVALPTNFYLKYRKAYPKRYRLEARRIKWIHWLARIFMLVTILTYFWPMLGTFYISGPVFIGMSIGFVAISAIVSKTVYERAAAAIPAEYFEKKKSPAQPAARKKSRSADPMIAPTVSYDSSTEKIHCIRCGAAITIKDGENLLKVRCPVCGAVQKKVERGYNHLLLDSDLHNTYTMLSEFLKEGDTALCLTTGHPSKLKRTYNLKGKLKCIWLTAAGGKDTLDPADLGKISATVEKFAEKYPASIILLDGFEYLVVEHGFDAVMRHIKKMTDVASMRDMTFIMPVNPSSLSSDELHTLKSEFDRTEALEDMDERDFF